MAAKETKEASPYLDITEAGGEGGSLFEFVSDKGQMLSLIEVWAGEKQIRGVRIVLSNELSQSFGTLVGESDQFDFQQGELITEMSLWVNKEKDFDYQRIAAIRFLTDKKREFFPKMTQKELGQEYPIEVGSGICVGAVGRSGVDIDKIGFKFVKPLMSSVMTDMTYPTLGTKKVAINIDSLDSVVYTNDLEIEQTVTHETSVTTTKKQSWSKTSSIQFSASIKVTVEASIPLLASSTVETTTGLTKSDSGTHAMEQSETKTNKWSFPFKIPAKSKVEVTASMGQADIDIPYTGKLVITTKDGSQLSIPVNGTYTGVAFTDVEITTKKVEQ